MKNIGKMTLGKDKVFAAKRKERSAFEFNKDVATVFDDMVSRSIPFYDEIHTLLLDLVKKQSLAKQTIYDLGCSTATSFILIDRYLKKLKKARPHYVGLDSSAPMLEVATKKVKKAKIESIELICEDVTKFKFKKTPLIIMNYTLQFIPKKERKDLLKNIYNALKPGGFFLLSEKLNTPSPKIQSLVTELYYDFKARNGYSKLEISQKREALENVLVPLEVNEQIKLLKQAGFTHVELIFRWYNFGCYLAIK